jgi:hypothetical protein
MGAAAEGFPDSAIGLLAGHLRISTEDRGTWRALCVLSILSMRFRASDFEFQEREERRDRTWPSVTVLLTCSGRDEALAGHAKSLTTFCFPRYEIGSEESDKDIASALFSFRS